MKYTTIKKCRCCNSNNLKKVINFGKMYLSTEFLKTYKNSEKIPMQLVFCKECHLIQLKHNYNSKRLYNNNYGYRSGINQSMKNHLHSIVTDLRKKISLRFKDVILDIASNDGTLLNFYNDKKFNLIGIDPTSSKFKKYYKSNIKTSNKIFSKNKFFNLSKNNKAKIITSIAVFYDIKNPKLFVKEISEILEKNGIWVLEQSYFAFLYKNNAYDSICHEHLTYFTYKQLKILLDIFSLKIIDVKFNKMNGGSVRFFIANKSSYFLVNENNLNKLKFLEREFYTNFEKKIEKFKTNYDKSTNKLYAFIKRLHKKKKKIHLYGASTKGNIILQCSSINNKYIEYASERNRQKVGKITPGSNIKIIDERTSRKMKPDYYFVMPWHFRKEIIKREHSFLKRGGKLIFPLPKINIH
tara:strand:+ start:495 stop:1727 length:1233 start_codon:yes stop_codon:yes gene_type:complete